MATDHSERLPTVGSGEQQLRHDAQQTADNDQVLSALVPGRLAVPSGDDLQEVLKQKWREQPQEVASRWQAISAWADFWEIGLVPRVQYGRPHELAGLIASGGEQLALAMAAIVEAKLWSNYRSTNALEPETIEKRSIIASQEMRQRAMADLASHYLLSAGHSVANVTVRALAFDSKLHPALIDTMGSWFPPESNDQKDWLSLGVDSIRKIRRVARKSEPRSLQHIAEPATRLLTSMHWQKLDQLRGHHYHRWRPQSAGLAGVSSRNPWTFADGVATMTDTVEYADGDGLADKATNLAVSAMSDLAVAMNDLLKAIELVIMELNSPPRK
jgi:hypothetical protein